MTRVKLIKNKEFGLLERDINEFIISVQNEAYYGNNKCYININDVKLVYESSNNIFIALVIYEINS